MVGTSFTPVPEIELSDISSYLEGEQRCLVLAEFSITLQELYSIIGTNRVSCYLVQLSILLFCALRRIAVVIMPLNVV